MMSEGYLMAFDLGTGSGRCTLLEIGTGVTYTAARRWSYAVAPGTAGLGHDMDLERMWSLLGEAAREVVRLSAARPGEVLGIAAGSMRNTTVVLGADGGALLATPNQDARGLVESLGLAADRGMEFHHVTGHWPGPIFTGIRLAWALSNAPQLIERAASVMCLSDWVGMRLSGRQCAERSQAGETLLFDHEKGDWAYGLVSSLGLPAGIFPETVDAGTPLGGLTPEAARHLGLEPGIPVSAGGADTQCGLLGSGCLSAGDTGILAGTGMPVQQVTERFLLDGEGRLWSGRHVLPGLFFVESNGMLTGTVLEWFSRIMYPDSPEPVRALLADAADSVPGGSGFLSTLGARIFDARSVGILFGSLTMSHMTAPDPGEGRCHVARALIEGIAYSARANLEQVESATGVSASSLAVSGGMARSPLWTQVVSDVTGRAVTVPSTHEATSLGTALCAGVGAGIYSGFAEGASSITAPGREHFPGENSEKYMRLYDGWSEAFSARADCDACTAGILTVALLERPASTAATPAEPSFRPVINVTAMMDETALEHLGELGEVRYEPWRDTLRVYDGGPELASALAGSSVFITEMDVVDLDALRGLPDLKAIVSCRVDPVNIDISAATAFGIPVMNTPGRNADAVADLTVALMLMLARRLPAAAQFLKGGNVESGDLARMGEAYALFKGGELWRKTVGLIGLGSVGLRVARRLVGFGAHVLFYDPGVGAGAGARAGAARCTLEELLARSDFVSLHAPALEATRGMLGREQFAMMKEGSYFVNTARASLVDEDALAGALESGRLGGAALDVFSVEPPGSESRLVSMDNVIATPHVGGNTAEVGAHQGALAAAELARLLAGGRPEHLLNPEVLPCFTWTGPRREPSGEELDGLSRNERPRMTS